MNKSDMDHLASSGCSECRDIARREVEFQVACSGRESRMSPEAAKKAIEMMAANQTLYFSQRYAVYQEFTAYCRSANQDADVTNFLAWLMTSETGHKVVRALVHEIARTATKGYPAAFAKRVATEDEFDVHVGLKLCGDNVVAVSPAPIAPPPIAPHDQCSGINDCEEVQALLGQDMLDQQAAEAIRCLCGKCPNYSEDVNQGYSATPAELRRQQDLRGRRLERGEPREGSKPNEG